MNQIDYEAMPLWDIVCASRDEVSRTGNPTHPLIEHLDHIEATLFSLEFMLTEYPAYTGDKS